MEWMVWCDEPMNLLVQGLRSSSFRLCGQVALKSSIPARSPKLSQFIIQLGDYVGTADSVRNLCGRLRKAK